MGSLSTMPSLAEPGQPLVVVKGLEPDIESLVLLDLKSEVLKHLGCMLCGWHSIVKVADTGLSLAPSISVKAALESIQAPPNILDGHVAQQCASRPQNSETLSGGRLHVGQVFEDVEANHCVHGLVGKRKTLGISLDPDSASPAKRREPILLGDPLPGDVQTEALYAPNVLEVRQYS